MKPHVYEVVSLSSLVLRCSLCQSIYQDDCDLTKTLMF